MLVDPSKAETLLGVNGDKDQAFLFSKQIEEADLICFTKADRFPSAPKSFGHQIRSISAKTGAGVTEWLDEVTSDSLAVGSKLLEIDYEEYARAEPALSWLNLRAEVWFEPPVSPQDFLVQLFRQLDDDFTANGIW